MTSNHIFLNGGISRRGSRLGAALLPCAIALALAACGGGGGGGGNIRPSPPPTTPSGPGFTPTVANDGTLTQVNPPAIPTQGAPVTFTDPAINRHLSLTNAMGALGAGLKGQGVTIGFVDSGVNRNHPTLTGRVTRHFINVGADNDLTVDDKIGHGTVVASLAAGRPAPGLYSGGETGNWGGGIAQNATVVSSHIIGDAPPDDDGSGEMADAPHGMIFQRDELGCRRTDLLHFLDRAAGQDRQQVAHDIGIGALGEVHSATSRPRLIGSVVPLGSTLAEISRRSPAPSAAGSTSTARILSSRRSIASASST